jgi:ankyrin repeat protein
MSESRPRRTLPERPDREQQQKQAKELLGSFRRGDAEAIARVRAELPDKQRITLADAQFVLAREYGFPSWAKLKERIRASAGRRLAPRERFKLAVEGKDADALRRVLEESAEARAAINDTIFAFDGTALLAAGNDLAMVDVLLEFGADPNKKSAWWAGGFHPLYAARGAVAERLIAAGAVADACALAHLDRAEELERMLAAKPERVHERGGDGQTPLHFATSRRIVDLLLAAGADIDARDVDHRSTAAEWMIGGEMSGPRPQLARYLVERGASADVFLVAALGLADRARAMLRESPGLLQLRTSQGNYAEMPPSSYHIYQWTIEPNFTPMQTAAKFGQTATLRVMEEFATPAQRLLLACNRGDRDTALAIVRANPGIVEGLPVEDQRALTDEAWMANGPAVELMLELGFDPSIPSVTGATGGNALHCASWEGSVECVTALLRHGRGRALINAREASYNGTPISWCCHGSVHCGNPRADHAEVARLLIAAGAELHHDMAEWGCGPGMQRVVADALDAGRV